MPDEFDWEEIADKLTPKQREPASPSGDDADPARLSAYGAAALRDEIAVLSAAVEGARNHQLNTSAYVLAQLCASGALDEQYVRSQLWTTALSIGLSPSETGSTIESGFRAGLAQPRQLDDAQLSPYIDSTPEHPFGSIRGVDLPLDFWSERLVLSRLFEWARSRRVSPWAVLGCALARVVCMAPPNLVLPPIVGSFASLNLFVGLVGRSGSGKGAAERVAREGLRLPRRIEVVTTGSGEGIAHAYKRRKGRGEIEDITDTVLFSVPEVDTLSALAGRQAATLLPELRRGWSGEALGFQYADASRRLRVEEHGYRMSLILGIQPERAKPLLDDADGGTPQRFVWLPAVDPSAPEARPLGPEPMTWIEPSWYAVERLDRFSGLSQFGVCETARKTIEEASDARLRGEQDALDGHALLCQLKVAAALALFESRLDVTDDDWRLAAYVMRVSSGTRSAVAQTLSQRFTQRNRSRAYADAERAVIIDDKRAEAITQYAARRVMTVLRQRESEASNVLRSAVKKDHRPAFDDAIDALLATGQIDRDDSGKGVRYVLREKR